MGDPSPRSQPLDLRLQGPARVIVLNAAGVDLIGAGKISGQYLAPNIIDRRDYPDRPEFDNRTAERKAIVKDYDIAVSHKNFDPAFDAFRTDALDTLAHEARHRGFRILWDTPEIMSKIPQDVRDKMFAPWEKGKDAPEHYMIYSVSMVPNGNNIGPDQYFKSLEEFKSWRRTYKAVEQAAKSYVMSMKVTPGGLAALRNEVDKMTPKDEVIKIMPGPKGAVAVGTTPTIKGIVDKVSAAASQGIDNVKSAITPAPEPPAVTPTPTQLPKVNGNLSGYKGNTGAQKLQQLNPGIKDVNVIYPGQKIKLPNNTTVTVKQGDTLDKIAARNNVKEDQLTRIRQLSGL
jgi:LysM repeat protein